jgi:hypothetical protein
MMAHEDGDDYSEKTAMTVKLEEYQNEKELEKIEWPEGIEYFGKSGGKQVIGYKKCSIVETFDTFCQIAKNFENVCPYAYNKDLGYVMSLPRHLGYFDFSVTL